MILMGGVRPKITAGKGGPLIVAAALALFAAGCRHEPPLDTKPLDNAGFSYSAIQELKSLNVSAAEIGDVAAARQGGLPENGCIELLRLYHQRGQVFDAGATVANFLQAGMLEDDVLKLAALGQLGLGSGELQAMRLAGLSDEIVLEVARRRAGGKTVLSGASLAGMRNTGLRNSTLLELVRRGVPDSQAPAIVALRRHRGTDADILRRFAGS